MVESNTKAHFAPLRLPEPTVVMSVDVEDYFMSPETILFSEWERFPSAIHTGMERCLNLFDEFGARATFFFVGWLAERYPEIVHRAYEQGTKSTHTYNHDYVFNLTEDQFNQSLKSSLDILRAICPQAEIIGHRAPAFSLQSDEMAV